MKKILLMTALALIASTPAMAKDTEAVGIVKSVDAEEHKAVIIHDPIPELGWPKMTMEFAVSPSIDLETVHEGDAIRFTLTVDKDENYSITNLKLNPASHSDERQ